MKNLLIIMAMVWSLSLRATIITVDNNYPSMGDYTTLQAAHDAANSGDTIVMFPSSFAYNGLVVSKKLNIYGSGWLNSTTVKTAIISGTISFNAGSQGSLLMGIYSYPNDCIINIEANSVSIMRNRLSSINVSSNIYGIVILNNYIYHETSDPVVLIGENSNIVVRNNFIKNAFSYIPATAVLAGDNCQLNFLNNIVEFSGSNYLCQNYIAIQSPSIGFVANNIFLYGWVVTNPNSTMNNLSMCVSWFATDALFINQGLGNYHLQPNSLASGTGYGGTDMGIYGGDFPFVDGGYPDLPAIYYLNVPSQASKQSGVNITIKAKSNN